MSQNTYMRNGTPNILEDSDVVMNTGPSFGYYEAVQVELEAPRSANIAALANPLALPMRSVTPPEPESTYDNIPENYTIHPPTKAEKRANEMEENRRTLFAFKEDDERIDYIRSILGLDEDDDDPEEIAGLTEGDLIEAGAELLTDQMSGGKRTKSKKAKKSRSKKTKKSKSKKTKKSNSRKQRKHRK